MSDNKFYRLGCDIGGTFTDFVLLNDETGEMRINKCLTTPSDPSDAVEQGIRELEEKTPDIVGKLDEVIHGTTLVINSIIERKGAKTGLITTRGFRDVLELGREIRYAPYDIFAEFPKPLVPRRFRLEVDERIRSDGTVIKALDPGEARKIVTQLLEIGVESISVCLLNSFENPAHELIIKEIIQELAPDISLSISYEVLPQIREYERTSTTVTNESFSSCFQAAESLRLRRPRNFLSGSLSQGRQRPLSRASTTGSSLISRKCSVSTWEGLPQSPA